MVPLDSREILDDLEILDPHKLELKENPVSPVKMV